MNECFKCQVIKPFTDFYIHKQTSSGYLGKCKECTKSDAITNRKANLEYYREYDRIRGNRHKAGYIKEYRDKSPRKYKAHTIVGNAIRDKKLFRESCEICANPETHGHHDDYSKPLNVRWLCAAHHKQWHDNNGEGLNP